jgi:hypothetical protein
VSAPKVTRPAEFKDKANGGGGEVSAYAAQTLPTLKTHLDIATSLQSKL